MKEYLKQFLVDFEYKESDASFLLSEYEKIASHRDANSTFNKIIADYEKYNRKLIELLEEIEQIYY